VKRALKISLLGLLALILVLVVGVAVLLGSQSGSRWLLTQVPGLQVQEFDGHLGGYWQADRLFWQQGDSQLSVDELVFDWSPSCLWRLTLCVERLQAERIAVGLAPSAPTSDSQPRLPDISLPLALQLNQVHIGSLQIDGVEQLQNLQLDARWTADGVQIDNLQVQREKLNINLHGSLQAQGNWPLNLAGTLQLPAPQGQPWQIDLHIDGNVRQSVLLNADSSGYMDGQLVAELQPLLENLPARAQLRLDAFKASPELPDTLHLNDLILDAQGDLASGYQLSGNAELPGNGGVVALTLNGVVDAEGARLDALKLSADEQQYVQLSGRLDWREGFSADSHLLWQDFPWQRLYPLEQQPPVQLRNLTADLSYADGNYLGNVVAELDGPAGDFSLSSPLSGDLQQLYLPDFKLHAGQGRVEGQLSLGFADAIRWDAQLELHEFDPAYWLEELPGTLAGPISSQGQLDNGQLSLSATVDIGGDLRGHPALLQARIQGAGEQWALDELQLRMGDNRIAGELASAERLSGQLRLDMPALGQLWPGLEGRLNGVLGLRGTLQAPAGQLTLQGQGVGFADTRMQRLQLDASLNNAQRAQIEAMVQGIAIGDTRLGQLSLSGQGDRQQQQLRLNLDGPELDASLAADGQLQDKVWRGRLSNAQLRLAEQTWQLQQPASLLRQADGQLNLGAHCWRSGAASLCAEDQRLLPEPQLRYRLANFPLDSLSPWFPEDFAWQGQLDGELQLDLAAAGPTGEIRVDAGSGTWRIREQQQWLDFAYDELSLKAQLQPQAIDAAVDLSGPRIGSLALRAQLDPRPADKPLSGTFRLQGLQLALARPFLPMVERLVGQLDGDGSLSGTLTAPRIDGLVSLRDGEIAGGELPMPIDDLGLQARIAGESLQLDGSWRSGESGQGKLDGSLAWGDALNGEVRVTGSRLPVTIEPYADIEVAPDLRITLAERKLAVSGQLAVPRGSIVIRELPPSTVKVSPDAQIVGQTEAERQALAIAMDIEVIVGEDRLSFSGFGLTADLAGRIHLGNDLDARGVLRLENGRYRAYGQRLSFRRARLLFAGPIDQPFLDVEAIRQVDDVTVGLRLTGNAEQPKTEIFSEPAMSQEQALSYLVLGRPLGQSAGDSNLLAQAALAMGLAGSKPLTNTVAGALGIENFQLDTEGSGVTTSVVASGELSERLSLRYGVGVFEPASTIALRYELTKRLYLEAASGLASSLDLFYRRDF
jgi:translocation and assembly module TamB